MKTFIKYIIIGLLVCLSYWPLPISCQFDGREQDMVVDSTEIIGQSLDYIFLNNQFAPTYYSQPLRVIKSINVPKDFNVVVNDKKCLLVKSPKYPDFFKDTDKPIPYVEVEKLKVNDNGSVEIDLIFRATGHWFMLELSKDEKLVWKVIKMEEATI